MLLVCVLVHSVMAVCDVSCGSCHLPAGAAWECDTCVGGLVLQPEGGLCFAYCPTGYTTGVGVCGPAAPGVVVDYVFDRITGTVPDRARGWVALNGATSAYYPSFEGTDPIPSKHRGSYFTGNSYILLPPLSGSADPSPLLGASASILAWIKTDLASGWQTIFSHFLPSASDEQSATLYRLFIRDDRSPFFSAQSLSLQGSVLSLNTWYCLTATMKFDSSTGSSTLTLYRNGAVDGTVSVVGKYVKGGTSAVMTIGMDYDLGMVPSDYFRGFIWEVKIWNYAISLTDVQGNILAANSPSSATFQLSTCGETFYDSGGSCLACLSSCVYGCVRGIDCYYCSDPLCTNCNSFEATATCTSCKFHASLVTGLCQCDAGYYFVAASGDCKACYAACKTCTGPATNQCTSCLTNAALSAGSCVCQSGYFYPTSSWTTCYICVNQASTGKCYCPPGYYRATGANTCSVCGAFCNSDMTGTVDGCDRCYTNAQMDHDVQEACYCSGATYLPMGGSACQACDSSCSRCDVGGPSGCTQCYGDSVLTPSPMGQCLCNGFHLAGSTACLTCAPVCLACDGPTASDCTTCYFGSVLTSSGNCVCAGSFYRAASGTCTPCHLTCATCTDGTAAGCTHCMNDSYLSSGKCVCSGSNYRLASGYCAPCHVTCYRCANSGVSDCTACYSDSTLTPSPQGKCLCNGGAYRPADLSACQPCYKTCTTCVEALNSDCSSCATDSYLSPTPTGQCLCSGSTYRPVNLSACLACDPTCYRCASGGISDCTTCNADSTLTPSPQGQCLCNGSTYRPLDFSACLPCDNTCLTCILGTSSDCLTCNPDSVLVPVSPGIGSCLCIGSTYHFPSTGVCVPCDPTCYRCADGGPSDCTACYTDSTLTPSPQGKCLCNGGTYRPADLSACQPCFKTCTTCVEALNSDCSSCATDSYLSPTPTGQCLCFDATYRPTDFSACLPCDNTCLTCILGTSNDCLTCNPDSVLVPAPPSTGSCMCLGSTYHSPNTGLCVPCDPTCYRCTSGTPFSCTSCYPDAYLLGTTCHCSGSFYRPAPSSYCQACYSECLTCTNGSPLGCTSCYPKAYLNSMAPGRCVCQDGYAGSPNTANCGVCAEGCENCLGLEESHCTTCGSGTVLVPAVQGAGHGWCRECPEATYFNDTNCAPCSSHCRLCTSAFHCSDCFSPFYLQSNYTCSSQCPAPSNCSLPSSNCFSGYLVPHINNNLSLIFSVNLSRPLTISDFSLTFSLTEYTEQPTWSLFEIQPTWNYLINVSYLHPVMPDSTARVIFLADLRGVHCESLATQIIYADLIDEYKGNSGSTAWPIPQAAIVMLLASSLLGGGLSTLWLTINVFQLISYLPYSYIPMSNNTRITLINGNIINSLFNPFDYIPSNTTPVPKYAANCDFDTALFLPNIGEIIITIAYLSVTFLFLALYSHFGSGRFASWCRLKCSEFQWNILIRLGLESYLPILIASGLQSVSIQNTVSCWCSSLLALVATIISFILPERSRVRLLSLPKAPKHIQHRWTELTEELTSFQKTPFGRFYNIFFCYRRLIYALIQVYLFDFPVIQGVLNVTHSVWFLLYVTFLVTYPLRRIHFLSIFLEFGSTLVVVLVQLFYLEPSTVEVRVLDYAVLGVICTMVTVAVCVQMSILIEQLWKLAKYKKIVFKQGKPETRGSVFDQRLEKIDFSADTI